MYVLSNSLVLMFKYYQVGNIFSIQGFFQDLGQAGAKRQYVIWWGGMALSTCTALDNVAESGGILNPPNFESFLFRASCVISGLKMHSVIWFLFHHTLV